LDWERIQLFCVENLVWILIVIVFIVFSALNPRFFDLSSYIFSSRSCYARFFGVRIRALPYRGEF